MNINQAFPRRGADHDAPDIPIPEIVGRLTGNIGALCEHLLPNGRHEGAEWRCGSVQGEPGKSLGVHLAGAKAGIWSDFADGSKGDPLDLNQACLRLDKGEAVLWAKDWLGLGNGTRAPLQPPPRPQHSEAPRQDNPNRALALDIWRAARPAPGTPVEAYLRGRGITIPVPPTLRYHPGVRYEHSGLLLPCMVCVIQAPDRSITAIHRIWIRDDGKGQANVASPKKTLGSINGGAVRLAYAGPKMIVAEGIETSLSVLEATGLPVWAALSASYFIGLALPALPLAAEIVIAAANDKIKDGKRAGIEAAEKAAAFWSSQGRKVSIALPPIPGTDFNKLARDGLSAREGFAA